MQKIIRIHRQTILQPNKKSGFFLLLFLGMGVIFCLFFSCKKEEFAEDSSFILHFSSDTVSFDTVFTNQGSSTRVLKVYNIYDKSIRITSVYLAASQHTGFNLNIDGQQTNATENLILSPKDSLFIFIETHIADGKNYLPEKDSIVFITNGNLQDVKLIAWGRDNTPLKATILNTNTTFTKDRAYLIYDSLVVSDNVLLMVEAGSQLFFHQGARLIVRGTLQVNGTKEEPVHLAGDRTEDFYEDIPSQWQGIIFQTVSTDNHLKNTRISNAVTGISAGTPYLHPGLMLSGCTIKNMSHLAIESIGAEIQADNCIFSNCGNGVIQALGGGNISLYHTTVANYYAYSSYSSNPAVYFSTEYKGSTGAYSSEMNLTLVNSIIDGQRSNEVDKDNQATATMNYLFDHCLLKTSNNWAKPSDSLHFRNVLFNKNPAFINPYEGNFMIDSLSDAINKGSIQYLTQFPFDIVDSTRLKDSLPDIGAYEFF